MQAKDLTKEIIFSKAKTGLTSKQLQIIHFNDVYNVEPSNTEPKAGAARFLTAVCCVKAESPCLVLFSGDCFSPSSLSLVTKGAQMVPVLNKLSIAAACVGNHDFDFGMDNLIALTGQTNFPWLLSNCCEARTGRPLAQAHAKHVVELNGVRVGLVGLVEMEWIEQIRWLKQEDIVYESFVDAGRRLAVELRELDKVDYVIALTHMRFPNDRLLAKQVF